MHTVYLATGANLGDKGRNLQTALEYIARDIGILSAVSSVYESEPWGYASDHSFFNQVVKVQTDLSPVELLQATQRIEKQMGRTRKSVSGYQDRVIDIDIILYDDLIYQSETLTIPHPLYRQRPFVMEPLKEILGAAKGHVVAEAATPNAPAPAESTEPSLRV